MADPLPIIDVKPKREAEGLVTLLHLSDLHFRAGVRYSKEDKEDFLTHLEAALGRCLAQGDKIDLIVVTGDLVDSETLSDRVHLDTLHAAKSYLQYLCGQVDVDHSTCLRVIPGNHDYRWAGNLFGGQLKKNFKVVFGDLNKHALYRGLKLLLACFDSNACGHPLEFAKGEVDITEFEHLRKQIEEMKKYKEVAQSEAMRIALVHHHVLPIQDSEHTKPRSWPDRLLGRRVAGAPEFMLLRNSGTFLHRLLQENFRLVLHGHLHKRGYWMPRTFLGGESCWLEVVSCGSCGQPDHGDSHTFNLVKIHTSGTIQSNHICFTDEGHVREPVELAMAGYDVIRARSWERRTQDASGVHIATWLQRWDVTLPSGDIKITRILKGVRSATGKRVDDFVLRGRSHGLTEAHFTVRSQTDRFTVTKSVVPAPSDEPSGFRCKVAFNPPLEGDRCVDLIWQSITYGSLYSSKEAQKYGRVPAAEFGVEGIKITFDRPCDRFLGNLRFFAPTPWLPQELTLNVLDAQNRPNSHESDHVAWNYWGPNFATTHTDDRKLCEAFIDIHRPQLQHQYLLSWQLPDQEPIPHRAEFHRLRMRLYDIDKTAPADAKAFCESVLDWLRAAMSREYSVTNWDDPHMDVSLFVFDGDSRLDLKASSSPRTVLPESFPWGQGIVGNAFRRRAPWVFSKLYSIEGAYIPYPLPSAISVLFALPLHVGTPVGLWPVGVITIASPVEDTRLHSLAHPQQEDARQRLWSNGVHLWHGLRDRLI
jgi:3',5'-cyclic AMP phosphodiesterase CpdA